MAVQVQRRGGTTAQHSTFKGANREITVDTTKKTLVVHDGVNAGGFPLAREDLSNVDPTGLPLAKDDMSNVSRDAIASRGIAKDDLTNVDMSPYANADLSNITVPFPSNIPTGIVLPIVSLSAPIDWLFLNGNTIGNLNSGADHAETKYQALFEVLWNTLDDVKAPVFGGRGGTAIEDWNADKTIQIPDARGRSIIGSGHGTGLTNRNIGSKGGSETHILTEAEMPNHNHTVFVRFDRSSGALGNAVYGDEPNYGQGDLPSSFTGGDQPHNNMQPWLALNYIIKI